MPVSRAERAARNNARWCDAVCRAHGAPGEFHDAVWLTRFPAPRFYPNAVTLTEDADAPLAHIAELVGKGLPAGWGVKDSFRALELSGLGFRLLFEAAWLWREPSRALPEDAAPGARWTIAQGEPELCRWEAVWSGNPESGSSTRERLFTPRLLSDPNVAFIAAYRGGDIVGGGIANRSDGVVGLSNVFAPRGESAAFWKGCVAAAQDRFPGLPLVGYERGPELTTARAAGFEPVGDLRVWNHLEGT